MLRPVALVSAAELSDAVLNGRESGTGATTETTAEYGGLRSVCHSSRSRRESRPSTGNG